MTHYDFQRFPLSMLEDVRAHLVERGYELVSAINTGQTTYAWFKANIDEWPEDIRNEYYRRLKQQRSDYEGYAATNAPLFM